MQKHLAKVNELKAKYNSLIMEGTYHDTRGFFNSNQRIEARSYLNGDQMAVIMAHPRNGTEKTALTVPGYVFSTSSTVGASAVKSKPDGTMEISIGKNALAILVYEKSSR